jgi:hypothetical protein
VPGCTTEPRIEIPRDPVVVAVRDDSGALPAESVAVLALDHTGVGITWQAAKVENGKATFWLKRDPSYRFDALWHGVYFHSAIVPSCAVPGCPDEPRIEVPRDPVVVTVLDGHGARPGIPVLARDHLGVGIVWQTTGPDGRASFWLRREAYSFDASVDGKTFQSGSAGSCGVPGCTSATIAASATSCAGLPAGASCSDGNPCNGEETCNGSGVCVAGAAPASCAVTPRVDCVVVHDNGLRTAVFGYGNASQNVVTVAPGLQNDVMPPLSTTSQPSSFSPGSHSAAFTVTFLHDTVTWKVGDRSAAADTGTPACVRQDCADGPGIATVAGCRTLTSEAPIVEPLAGQLLMSVADANWRPWLLVHWNTGESFGRCVKAIRRRSLARKPCNVQSRC